MGIKSTLLRNPSGSGRFDFRFQGRSVASLNFAANFAGRFAAVVMAIVLMSQSAQAISLDAFLKDVQSSNPSIRAVENSALAAKSRAEASGSFDDPFFAVGLEDVPKNDSSGGMLRYQLSQTIPIWGKRSARLDAGRLRAASVASDANTFKRQLDVIATQAYARAYFTQKSVDTNKRVRELLQSLVESTKARYQTGGGAHHEWLLAKTEVSLLDVERLRLERDLKVQIGTLNELRGKDPGEKFEIEQFSLGTPNHEPQKLDEALRNQPELISWSVISDATNAERRLARLSYFPDLVLQGMYDQPRSMPMLEGEPEPASTWGVMVGFTIPLLFFEKQSNLVAAAGFEAEAASQARHALELKLSKEWIEAEEQLKTAQDLVRLYAKEVLPNTELALANAKSAYVARRLPLSQFVEILRTQRTQELEFAAAQIDVEMARLRKSHLLSEPPTLRLAPARPSLFGGAMGDSGSMGDGMGSDATGMGKGMSPPSVRPGSKPGSAGTGGGSGGMGGM